MGAPVLGLPGRGIDISLGLAYNSRLWNKAGNQITYDIDRGWPAPGFSLGFGKLMSMGVMNGAMLVDADGTRHGYSGEVTVYSWGSTFVGHTTDGTFIDYSYTSVASGAIVYAQAKLPNGTLIYYTAPGEGAIYPTWIEDANGNLIIITYVNNTGPRIAAITDTLNRPINFHYNENNLLTAITGPGYDNSVRTLVRLHYQSLTLNHSFSWPITPVVREQSPWVIDAIYYPGTNTGYWLGDSYSTYGMLAKVSERRNMTFSAASLNDHGTVTSTGEMTREEVYNYPLTTSDPGGSGLTDAPTYSTLTERWTRDGVNTDEAATSYSVPTPAPGQPNTVTMTLPNGTKSVQYSHNASGSFLDGLVYQDQTLDSGNNVLQSSSVSWEQGAYGSPRPTRVEATIGTLNPTATEFSYGSVYNQVTEVRNYDYGGTPLLRSTRTQYQNSTNYTNRHIFNLPLKVEIYASDNATRVSQIDYQYDGPGMTLQNTPGVVKHDASSDPYTTETVPGPTCCQWAFDEQGRYCEEYCEVSAYKPETDYRGNVTQVTTYANASTEPASGPITETHKYDITGNMVAASTSCCQQASFSFNIDTQYAYPLSQTRGSATDPYKQVTTSATYDFNTGLVMTATDANGRTSWTSYSANTLRPQMAILPSNARTEYAYDDSAMRVTQTTYLATSPGDTGAMADKNIKQLNGRGHVRQEQALGDNGVWDFVAAVYDNLGRVSQQSRPYRSGDTLQWSTMTYDALSRVVSAQAPDGSTTQTFYNEATRPDVASTAAGETTRVVDAWGRERWGRTDAQGRLVEVVEPNPSGSGSVAAGGLVTTYAYNTLGALTTVTQGAQTRSFQYDSLGRLTAQKLAETSAKLNDAGTYVGSGTWSDVFSYDDRSNLISRTDARGVKTVYTFNNDPLNRLQSVSWDTSGFGDSANPILSAATVSYQYRTKGSPSELTDITQLASVTTAGINTESYVYDSEGRVSSKTQTLASRPSYPFVTDYTFDTLDRITDVRYPAEYGNGTQPRKLIHHSYDVASRLTSLTVDGATHASNIVYNAASQTTSLNVGGSGPNQMIESYNYDQQTGLLASQSAARSAAPTNWLLNLSYDYLRAGTNSGRTGQLTKILNNLNQNKDRSYTYDALGRLVQAKGGPASAPLWTQTYSYDRFGNRTSVSASGYSAKNGSALSEPPAVAGGPSAGNAKPGSASGSPAMSADAGSAGILPAMSAERERGGSPTVREGLSSTNLSLSDSASNSPALTGQAANSHHASPSARTNPATPQGGPPVFTDDPLVPGVTNIKAVHITELRTAVNQARARGGLSAANWAETLTTGTTIKAAHIVELRARLAEGRAALGLSVASYTDPSLSIGTTVKAAHIQELRQRVTEAVTANFTIPRDGHAILSYDSATNRITTAGFAYDAAGNQVRALIPGSSNSQRFQYDAANRLVKVKTDDNQTVIASYTYGDSNERLIAEEGSLRTYYACDASAEYVESGASTTPQWSKTYIYLGARLLSTLTPNGSGGELVQYHHPDRLGTRLVTNAQDTTYFEQVTLPFGTALNAESTGSSNRRFTSYDRSSTTGLDYAVNRHYDAQQGRFTQVDPIGMQAAQLEHPQTLNLYSYVGNDPINHTDPDGLFFGWLKKLFKGIGKVFSAVGNAVARVLNNRWVRIGVFIASFLVPFLSPAVAAIVKLSLRIYNTIADIASSLQLTGQLLQGKFKELAINLGLGLVSSAISTIADRVMRGVQDAHSPKTASSV